MNMSLQSYPYAIVSTIYLQIRGVTEDLSEIVFSKYYISAYADYVGMNSERGYAQYTETQIGEALEACLHIYNQQTHADLRLVFFKEAARHATRISRLLVSRWEV